MKILLTGATGFVGAQVARKLVDEGHEVYALIRPHSNIWRIRDIFPHLKVVPHDLFSPVEMDKCAEQIRPDLCIHLAWYAESGKYLSSLENVRFLSATLQLGVRLATVGCRRFLGAGTCFEYDTSLGYLSENTPTAPRSLYAASKLSCHLTLDQLGKQTGMEIAWLRFFYLYGPYEDERRLVPSVISSLLDNREVKVTEGKQVRDYLHVEDVADALWAVAQSRLTGPVNIGSGTPITVREIVNRIGDILGRQHLINFGALTYSPSDPMFVCANNALLTRKTQWTARYNLTAGLRRTVEWWQIYRENGNFVEPRPRRV